MLLKNLRIVTSTTLTDQVQHIRVTDGQIAEIGSELTAHDGEEVLAGWICMYTYVNQVMSIKKP